MTSSDAYDLVRRAAARWPNATAVESPDSSLTFRALDSGTDAVAGRLRALGAGPGSRIASRAAGAAQVTAILATIRVGATAIPVGSRWPDAGVEDTLELAAPVLRIGSAPGTELPADELATLAAGSVSPPPVRSEAGSGQPATVLFTSGSGSRRKAVVHRLPAHRISAQAAVDHTGLKEGDRWLSPLSLDHVGGLAPVFRCLLSGATLVIPPDGRLAAGDLHRSGITHVSLVDTQLARLLAEPGHAPRELRVVLLGGGPVNPDRLDAAAAAGWPVVSSYGMTETASLVTASEPGASATGPSSGRPLVHTEIRIASDGEVLLRGSTLFDGYLDGGRVDDPRDPDGWFHTGDLGHTDESGALTVTGRMDRRFVSGGENVQPEAIERFLSAMPGVRAVVVVPATDPEYGERPVAFVDGPIDTERARAAIRDVLPGFMVPVAFHPFPVADPPGGIKWSPEGLRDWLRHVDPDAAATTGPAGEGASAS